MTDPCQFIGRKPWDHSMIESAPGYDTVLHHLTANDWPIDANRVGCIISLYLFIQRYDVADSHDSNLARVQLRIVTAAHGTVIHEVSLDPDGTDPKYVFSNPEPPDYLLEAGDNIEFWGIDPSFSEGMFVFDWGYEMVQYDPAAP